jgi:hypothetical protein
VDGRGEQWIVVPNWDKFQHYKDRNPVWLKLYTELIEKDEWNRLEALEQALVVNVWMLYGLTQGQVTVTTAARRVPYRIYTRTWDSLVRHGFIQLAASKPLALRYPRLEVREEKNYARTRETKKQPQPTAAEPRSNAAAYKPFDDGTDWPA